jgi:hypothetical protein
MPGVSARLHVRAAGRLHAGRWCLRCRAARARCLRRRQLCRRTKKSHSPAARAHSGTLRARTELRARRRRV